MLFGSFAIARTHRYAVVLLFVSAIVLAAALYGVERIQRTIGSLVDANTAAESYLSGLKDVETAYRGYVVVGSVAYLEPFSAALGQFDVLSKRLETTASDADVPADLVAQTRMAGEQEVEFARAVILAGSDNLERGRDLVRSGRGKAIMDIARTNIGRIQRQSIDQALHLQRQTLPIAYWAASLATLALLTGGVLLVFAIRAAQRASSISRALVGDVIEKAPVGLVLLDSRQRVAQRNSTVARLFGADGDVGQPLALVYPALFEHVRSDVERVMQSRSRKARVEAEGDAPVLQTLQHGRARFFRTTVFPISVVGDGGEERGAGIIVNDVTRERERELELQGAKDEAESANRAKSAFIANMSHELRTPLTAVLGYTELIEEELADRGDDALLADLSKISVNARHLLSLINNVLDLSKIEAEKMDVNAVDCDLGGILDDVVSAAGGLVANHGNELVVERPPKAVAIHTDELKVKQILLNLLGNAAKFTTGGRIGITASVEQRSGNDWIRIDVADTGVGMSEAQLGRLFERFSQADETTTREYGGTGLGLALTRALATLIGGTIAVESAVDAGSTFTLLFPARYSAIAVATVEDESATDAVLPEGAGPLVLVVDDEPSAREFLTRHLKREGFSVVTASRGGEALQRVRRTRPAAVLLDVMMPGIDGWHVLRSLKADPATADIPVIVQTVLDDNGFARLMGASGYLQKPITRTAMAEMLADVVPASGVRRAIVVADAGSGRDELTDALGADGWSTAVAHDAETALAALDATPPDLLLVDLTMANRNGYAVTREVRKQQRWNAVPIVAITPNDLDPERMQRLKADAIKVVEDTMTTSDLVAELRRHSASGASAAGFASVADAAIPQPRAAPAANTTTVPSPLP